MMDSRGIPLSRLNALLEARINGDPDLRDVWVVAQTSDLRVSGGHCYLELLDKDDSGRILAKARATIWANVYARLSARFSAVTGTALRSDIRILARVTVSFHRLYGLSLQITDIDPDFTVGDMVRRRMEILARLRDEGVLDLNRTLPMPATPVRVAIISAPGAAGYGDFMRQLMLNSARLKFETSLFPAVMQGDRTVPSIIAALEAVMESGRDFDCAVIIRGGGATSDLAAFDDYDLASNVAQFPIPVIIGIGHERDVTVLDYVAHKRVKTPTAAAEFLVETLGRTLDDILTAGRELLTMVRDRMFGERRRLDISATQLASYSAGLLSNRRTRLGSDIPRSIAAEVRRIVTRHSDRLSAAEALMTAVSPEATLKRGFSITRIDGHAVTDASALSPGQVIETTLLNGSIKSTVSNE